LESRGRRISEFEANLVYKVSSRTARAIQRNPVSKNKNKNKTNKQTNKKNTESGAGEIAQWLRALTVLPKVLSSNPSNHMVAHNHP
jgi:ribosomal protein S19